MTPCLSMPIPDSTFQSTLRQKREKSHIRKSGPALPPFSGKAASATESVLDSQHGRKVPRASHVCAAAERVPGRRRAASGAPGPRVRRPPPTWLRFPGWPRNAAPRRALREDGPSARQQRWSVRRVSAVDAARRAQNIDVRRAE